MSAITSASASELFRSPPDRFLDVGAGEVAYRRVGQGPDVLLVHGWPVSGATFRLLLPYLSEHVSCHVIDLPGAGQSRFDAGTRITLAQHIKTVRAVVDLLGFDNVAVVGHDSGGMIARHALAGDARVRAMGLIDTEQLSIGLRFRAFVATRRIPGLAAALGWVAGAPRVRRSEFVFGGAFADRQLLEGEFDEFFLSPLRTSAPHRAAAAKLLKTFDLDFVRTLREVHPRITAPVGLVWGEQDVFFPLARAREMVSSFPDARLDVIASAGLFSHEERPAEVAAALLPLLVGAEL
jgi:pimeloyl-ACP methyl ester carboxylesterase